MLKKAGLLTVGVTAGLLAVAPIASAGESSHHDSDNDKKSSHDHEHGKKHHSKKHGDDQEGVGNIKCDARSGDAKTKNDADSPLSGLAQAGSVLSGNAGQIASCNSFLNDNVNNNELNIASPLAL